MSLEVGYLSAGLLAHFAIKDPTIFVLCYHPVVSLIITKWLPVPGVTTTSKDMKQGIDSLWKVIFYLGNTIPPKTLS